MNKALTVVDSEAPVPQRESWGGAAERGLKAREERKAIIAQVLREGPDFGIIPGTDKPTLLKPGAEKIADSLNLYPAYEREQKVEDWEKPLFYFAYRCFLKVRGSDVTIATGVGSCNSMETKYRWRDKKRACPKCGREAIIKGKAEFGGGWLCFAKKGGCGAKWKDGAEEIESQKTERVANEAIFDQVNTIDKMAQKRALIAATLNLGFSEQFTQDVEDLMDSHHVEIEHQEPKAKAEDFDLVKFGENEPASISNFKGATNLWVILNGVFSKEWAEKNGFKASKNPVKWFRSYDPTLAKECRAMIDADKKQDLPF